MHALLSAIPKHDIVWGVNINVGCPLDPIELVCLLACDMVDLKLGLHAKNVPEKIMYMQDVIINYHTYGT